MTYLCPPKSFFKQKQEINQKVTREDNKPVNELMANTIYSKQKQLLIQSQKFNSVKRHANPINQ